MAGTAPRRFLAGSPGALSQITMLAVERGADLPAIAVVQTMRVIILTAALPMLLALTGVLATASAPSRGHSATPPRRSNWPSWSPRRWRCAAAAAG